jgi:hypothetical protein
MQLKSLDNFPVSPSLENWGSPRPPKALGICRSFLGKLFILLVDFTIV